MKDCYNCLFKEQCPFPDEQYEKGECEEETMYWVREKHPYYPDEGEDRS